MPQPLSSSILGAQDTYDAVSACFSQFTELHTKGFNRLIRAQRYGRWWMLKGLKAEYVDQEFYGQENETSNM